MSTIDTSIAVQEDLNLWDYDRKNISGIYTDKTNPSVPVPIDLTNYKFEFILKKGTDTMKSYTLAAGTLSNAYLVKQGADLNELNMVGMLNDIRDLAKVGTAYRLIQVVTDDADITYVYIVYNVHAKSH